MKKVFAIVTAVALMFVISAAISSPKLFFTATEDIDLDLSEYTMDDIGDMSSEELGELLYKYQRVYDPFGN